jgi:hypothetical protein
MADREFSSHQRKIIRRFYDNREGVDQQRLSELVADLYLAEGKKRTKLWEQVTGMMERLGVPATRITHVVQSDNAALLAEVVKDIQSGVIRPPAADKPVKVVPSDNIE